MITRQRVDQFVVPVQVGLRDRDHLPVLYSPNSLAPIGTMRKGASEPIRAALATLLCVAPAKNALTPVIRQNATRTPGDSARLTRVELNENAITTPTTASAPHAFALMAR